VDEGGGAMSALQLAVLGHLEPAFLGQFGDAIGYIFNSRESVAGGAEVGGTQFLELLWKHVLISGVAVLVACAVAIPIGLWLGHIGRFQFIAVGTSNVGRAVPSLAVIAFFFAYVGVGFWVVMAALALLAIPPILTNAYVGLQQVDRGTIDAARGMGMTEQEIVRDVELPLALPLIFGGIKTSAVNVVATATIAPLAGWVTLGDPIINVSTYGDAGRLAAAILVALLAIATELSLGAVQRAVTPTGLKLASHDEGRRRSRFPITKRRLEARP
jgi:osmoprotectant transport system permease protein